MLLRDVEPGDLDAYVRMRCDPAMMAELGGPLPRHGIEAKVETDVRKTRADEYWVSMIVPDAAAPEVVAGSVALWSHEDEGEVLSEIGWMVLPEFQGEGYARRAVRAVLERARDDGRWAVVHAFPGVANAASNALCRSVGFTLVGERQVIFRRPRAPHEPLADRSEHRPRLSLGRLVSRREGVQVHRAGVDVHDEGLRTVNRGWQPHDRGGRRQIVAARGIAPDEVVLDGTDHDIPRARSTHGRGDHRARAAPPRDDVDRVGIRPSDARLLRLNREIAPGQQDALRSAPEVVDDG